VYVHKDLEGNIFYVGKGCGQRAWSTDTGGALALISSFPLGTGPGASWSEGTKVTSILGRFAASLLPPAPIFKGPRG